ncbi:MAG: transporter substrate-binding domain-containing protein, partial [Clostridia bacterium]|nr:transporter substrate-binding domain-containing protein [Clostridia bacterium]
DEGFNFTKIKDLNREGLRIGVIAGRVGEKVINEAVASGKLKGVNVIVYDTDKDAKTALYNENVDCAVLDELPAKIMVKELTTGRK